MGWMPSVAIFLRDPSPYLREFRRKPVKTPNRQVNKHDPGVEPGTSLKYGQFNVHALAGIRTQNLRCSSRLPQPLHRLVGLQKSDVRFLLLKSSSNVRTTTMHKDSKQNVCKILNTLNEVSFIFLNALKGMSQCVLVQIFLVQIHDIQEFLLCCIFIA